MVTVMVERFGKGDCIDLSRLYFETCMRWRVIDCQYSVSLPGVYIHPSAGTLKTMLKMKPTVHAVWLIRIPSKVKFKCLPMYDDKIEVSVLLLREDKGHYS